MIIFVIAKEGFSGSLIFYDSMMVDVTTDERMDEVSSHGYAWGYIGSCVPFVISLLLVLGGDKVGISTPAAMTAAFFLNAAWWGLVTIPLLKNYEQKEGNFFVIFQFRHTSSKSGKRLLYHGALIFHIIFLFVIFQKLDCHK